MENVYEVLLALLRRQLFAFVRKVFETVCPGDEFLPAWYVRAIGWHLEQCAEGKIKRLIVTLPPRYMKSICGSVAFPAWILGKDPTARIMCISYSDDLAGFFSRQCREVMESRWYRKAFPKLRLSRRKNTEQEIVTTKGGYRLATSIRGGITGRGADIIIIDDPIKATKAMSLAELEYVVETYKRSIYSRLNSKKDGVIILLMQRMHCLDLAGHLMELGGWTVLNLPAVAPEAATIPIGDGEVYERKAGEVLLPEYEDLDELEATKRQIGSVVYEAQYQQNPLPLEGNMVKAEWFKRYRGRLPAEKFSQIVQSWDTATETGDACSYSVCTTWGIVENRYYLLDVVRGRMDFPALQRKVVRHARAWGVARVLVEKAASGHALLQVLRTQTDVPVIAIKPEFDKETRMAQVSGRIEAGHVFLPEDASWLGEFEQELFVFPNGEFDDQVDSMTQFLRWVDYHQPPELEVRITTFPRRTTTFYDRMGGSFPF